MPFAALGSLKFIIAGIVLAVMLAVVSGFWLNYRHEQDARVAAEQKAAVAQQVNDATVKAVAERDAALARSNAAVASLQTEVVKRDAAFDQIKRTISHAKPSDVGPVAPVLRDTIDSLYGPATATGPVPNGQSPSRPSAPPMPGQPTAARH